MPGLMNRARSLDRLDGGDFDILVIGGGATGLGTAVDAAVRGYRVALLEQADFAQATSSRSTKLIHGGVRYLRQGNMALVRQALLERARLLRNAPHLVEPLSFVIPAWSWWQAGWYGAGLKVYDALAGRLGLQRSRWVSRAEVRRLIPDLRGNGLRAGVWYQDARFDDARLAVHLAMTAHDHGAVLANHTRVTALVKSGGRVAGVRALDQETGSEFKVRARVVVNATGVFTDQVRRLDDAAAGPMVTASQGVHLVLSGSWLPEGTALMIPKTSDGRVLFAVPWRDRVLLGTTDTPVSEVRLEPRPLEEELDFLLEHARLYLGPTVWAGDVRSVYAGLRPLVRARGIASTSRLARDHVVVESSSGLLTVTGGKWTTYRKMAEDVVDRAAGSAGLPLRACGTADLPLHGAAGWSEGDDGLERAYGGDAAAVRALMDGDPDLAQPLHPDLPYVRAEVVWQARHEMARRVEDVLARRTRALVLDAKAALESAPLVARLMADELGFDVQWQAREVAAFRELEQAHMMPGAK